ncbi:hypothetical protein AB835_04490 [Candidatus Endobugula sertula]|uniref:Aspartyl protease n=1 Tax=Candidatus Endobugula sertula TaxID=62101 RepID=A0A1D2QRV2_9GAMM|nr:hypothetical protein AB835_04490 [Candidatus Endobugula sertula]
MRLYVLLLSILSFPAAAVDSVQIKGLFNKRAAVLVVDGQQTVIKVGKTKLGVTLLEATSEEAVLYFNGSEHRIGLSKQIGGTYQKPTKNSVRISSRNGGHYWVPGNVNGVSIRFVVDTGATNISISVSMAKHLGLDYKKGGLVSVVTANGTTQARIVTLKKVSVGSITQHQVRAAVMIDDSLPVALLGNSFLRGVDMRTENGVLVLTERF